MKSWRRKRRIKFQLKFEVEYIFVLHTYHLLIILIPMRVSAFIHFYNQNVVQHDDPFLSTTTTCSPLFEVVVWTTVVTADDEAFGLA